MLEVLERVEALGLDQQIVVVDDGSRDGTGEVLRKWHAVHPDDVLLHQANAGKGAALRAAIPHVDGDIVVIQDAMRRRTRDSEVQ